MTGSMRRGIVTVGTVAVLTGGLGACAGVSWTPDRDPTTAAPEGMTEPVVTAAPITPTLPTASTAPSTTPTPTPRISATPKPSVTVTPKPEPSPTATSKPKPKPSASTPPATASLRVGDRGPAVLALQERLSALGYWMGEPDGHFGALTQQAVWALQKSAGISRTGRVGPRTQRALDDGVRPRTRLGGSGVDIDLQRQILMIVRGGQVKYILNTSTGGGYEYERKDGSTATARTPKGTFRVGYVVDGRDEGFLGEMWRPRYFNGGYAVHGSPSIPAHPASHGCARVSNSAMNMIWSQNHMPKGSTVLVR
ncbi:L,D-transpeptidase family protein [Knoellia aerolata]|uniref:Endopeptidase n=1 Tax=Knoellia aerolata DSM 18566 TaxID=1385519 RepID=A0A0A0JYA7_9MICO|nr:L,D-transpeptidase family protein [Knoellia aerolata]KGN41729.1 endopeptidase [Knoellia aerolata DSM 18566]